MIASVRGDVIIRRPGEVVIESAGVGYKLAVSAQTLSAVPDAGKEAQLFAHLVIRDDAMSLYGFATEDERALFLMLIGVQAVGPKVAQAALGGAPTGELLTAIATGDAERFQEVPGIGKRTAERIIVELRDRVAEEIVITRTRTRTGRRDEPAEIARDGLANLGYADREIDEMLAEASGETAEALLSSALKAGR